jgi:hypothetical protein
MTHDPQADQAPLRDVDVALLRDRMVRLSDRLSDDQILSLSRALNGVLSRRRRGQPQPRVDITL